MPVYHLSGALRGSKLHEVWIADGIICYTQPESLPASGIEEIRGYIYPGLLDAHTHPGVSRTAEPVSDADVLERLAACRSLGVTAIRDCGGQRNPNDVFTKDVSPQGYPKVLHCGQHIARYKRYIRYMPIDVEPSQLPEEAARQAQASDGWIKIVGDWIDRSLGTQADLRPLWPREVLIDAVAAAHDNGARVAVHSFARSTIDDLLDASVDSIEHGTGMTPDHLLEARMRGILIDPTVCQISRFPEFAADAGSKYPVYRDTMLSMDAHRVEHIAMMVDVGVDFLMGSDTAPAHELRERGLPVELVTAVRNGIPPATVMAAASFAGRSRLGFSNWEQGAPADFVVYDNDPERDISAVLKPTHVLIDGILV
ncbi:MAG: amidohydrolase family protein [Actinomycetaceae bacterium]|nr:amidohydrolase family protein [Arcanobacterium sp.]MDD7505812.1 amidohydrolase family protein [Actinomycetaceae bacterium]MDY6142877.1 amidohydrolase family protein [Arcanobacterium sp.]